jgi:hypothetical protein
MHSIQDIRPDLVEKFLQEPSLEILRELFIARTNVWIYPFSLGEGGDDLTFGDLVRPLEPNQAFTLIDYPLQLALEQTNGELFATALFLLADFAKATTTTEIPASLNQSWDALADLSQRFPTTDAAFYFNELRSWYSVSLRTQTRE